MLDGKSIVGTFFTLGAGALSWVEQATAYGQLALTVIGSLVGVATLYYTVLRARKVRAELRDREEKRDA